jgi:hypothetical protein
MNRRHAYVVCVCLALVALPLVTAGAVGTAATVSQTDEDGEDDVDEEDGEDDVDEEDGEDDRGGPPEHAGPPWNDDEDDDRRRPPGHAGPPRDDEDGREVDREDDDEDEGQETDSEDDEQETNEDDEDDNSGSVPPVVVPSPTPTPAPSTPTPTSVEPTPSPEVRTLAPSPETQTTTPSPETQTTTPSPETQTTTPSPETQTPTATGGARSVGSQSREPSPDARQRTTPTPLPMWDDTPTARFVDSPTGRNATPRERSSPTTATMQSPTATRVTVTAVTVNRSRVVAGTPVGIGVTVANGGPRAASTTVRLRLFGEVARVRKVGVPAGGQQEVEFAAVIEAPGTYHPSAGGKRATVRVVEENGADRSPAPGTSAGTGPGFTALVALCGLAAVGALAGRRR